MAYIQLDLPDSLPGPVKAVIGKSVEPLFHDVHWMLGTTIGEYSDSAPRRQLQVPIAHTLLAAVSGISAKLYLPLETEKTTLGARFGNCLTRFFPWDVDPPTGVSNEEAAEILYQTFRNPLSHYLGIDDKKSARVVKIGQAFRGTSDAESRVEALERLTVKPYSDPCLVVTPEKCVLWLDPFYWGVRKLVERWSRDADQVSNVAKKFA